jgi:SAM-dependent methyltransferase
MRTSVSNAFLKFLVDTVGQTSDSLRICKTYGLTSGKHLDYIYQNKPSGRWIIGPWIDRWFIRHPGWESIRARKKYLAGFLSRAIDSVLKRNANVYIVDIASGPARYILEVMSLYREQPVSATCRDIDPHWLAEGTENARKMALRNIEFVSGNALSAESFLALSKTPTIMVSSGFYDWIVDDELVKSSMKIIYDQLEKGGYFIFTNQCGHVDLELVASIFQDFNQQPLIMKVREARQINAWAQEIGFQILETQTDTLNYYSVTFAQK